MSLRNEFEVSGTWLFRFRSYLPLLALPLIILAMMSFTYLGNEERLDDIWDVFSLFISLCGLAVRIFTIGYAPKGTSGRNTSQQIAETLNTTGIYSLVRHPLYLGNYLIWLGVAVFFHTWWMPLLTTCAYALYYERIMFAEEKFLQERFGESFNRWASVTPAIIPKLRGWKRPALKFSWRTVLRREYTGFFGIVAMFSVLEFAGDSIAARHLEIDRDWVAFLIFGTAVYLTLRTLKKKTHVLDVPGRQ